jgi:hypothetical protein
VKKWTHDLRNSQRKRYKWPVNTWSRVQLPWF